MAMMKSNEDLRARLQESMGHGEEILDAGMGAIGPRTVLVGVTGSRLLLEYVTVTMKTRRLEEIPFSQLEAIETRKGDSTIPGWAKINVHNAILNALTTSLIVRKTGERSIHITFHSLPRFTDNRSAGFRIARIVSSGRPDLATTVDLASEREEEGSGWSRFYRAGAVTGVIFCIPLAIAGGVPGAAGGFLAGFITGGVFGIFWPYLKRTVTGRG